MLFFFSSATTDDIDGVTYLALLSTAGGTTAVVVADPFAAFGGVLGALRLGPSPDFFFDGDLARFVGVLAAAGGAAASVLRGRLLGDDMVLLLLC